MTARPRISAQAAPPSCIFAGAATYSPTFAISNSVWGPRGARGSGAGGRRHALVPYISAITRTSRRASLWKVRAVALTSALRRALEAGAALRRDLPGPATAEKGR